MRPKEVLVVCGIGLQEKLQICSASAGRQTAKKFNVLFHGDRISLTKCHQRGAAPPFTVVAVHRTNRPAVGRRRSRMHPRQRVLDFLCGWPGGR